MRCFITHITKDDFFPAFKNAFLNALTEKNIKGGFRGAGLDPFSPESVLSQLNIRLYTPEPRTLDPVLTSNWTPKTPQNTIELEHQTKYLTRQVANHQNSSPAAIFNSIRQIERGAARVMQQNTLLKEDLLATQKANDMLSKRQRAKKTRIQTGGYLEQEQGEGILAENENERLQQEETQEARPRARRCSQCGETGHNARTCKANVGSSDDNLSQ